MMIASGFCCTAELMIGIWVDAPASVGPVMRFEPPSSFSASSTPECSNSSYGLPSCFGMETVFSPALIVALGSAPPELELLDELPLPDDADESSFVDPHAEIMSATSTASAVRTFMTWTPPQGGDWRGADAPR